MDVILWDPSLYVHWCYYSDAHNIFIVYLSCFHSSSHIPESDCDAPDLASIKTQDKITAKSVLWLFSGKTYKVQPPPTYEWAQQGFSGRFPKKWGVKHNTSVTDPPNNKVLTAWNDSMITHRSFLNPAQVHDPRFVNKSFSMIYTWLIHQAHALFFCSLQPHSSSSSFYSVLDETWNYLRRRTRGFGSIAISSGSLSFNTSHG